MTDRNYEAEARAEGWVPLSEWKGDPEKHIEAETFVKRGEEILPIVNAKLRKANERIEALSKQQDELRAGNEKFKEFHNETLKRKEEENAQLRKNLEIAREKAINEGDGKAFTAADTKLRQLDTQAKNAKAASQDPMPEHTKAWLEDNPWYQKDRALRAMADGFAEELATTRPELVGKRDFLDEVTKIVKESLPEKFQNPERKDPPVGGEGNKGGNGKAHTFDNLPKEAQEAAIRFEKTHGLSRKDYVSQYPWDE